jgi:hypothetical protein
VRFGGAMMQSLHFNPSVSIKDALRRVFIFFQRAEPAAMSIRRFIEALHG